MNVSLFRQHLALKHRHYVTEQDDRQPEYRAYFNGMMKKHGYDSPADIPDDKKKAFFDAVDKGYTAKNESTTPGAAHAAYYKQHKITHIVAKKDLAAHKKWMDSEGFDTHTVPLSDNDRDAKTHVGIVSKGNVESSYHVDGFAQPIKEGYLKEDKKSDAWECMHCGNIWRAQHGARQCPKCHNENIVLGKFISGRA
jgi:rubrerythrin